MAPSLVLLMFLALCQNGRFVTSSGWNISHSLQTEYKLFANDSSYFEAQRKCEKENASLVSICSAQEQRTILEIVGNRNIENGIWIGYYCKSDQKQCNKTEEWTWSNKQQCNYTNWKTGHPKKRKYAYLNIDALEWFSIGTIYKKPFICKRAEQILGSTKKSVTTVPGKGSSRRNPQGRVSVTRSGETGVRPTTPGSKKTQSDVSGRDNSSLQSSGFSWKTLLVIVICVVVLVVLVVLIIVIVWWRRRKQSHDINGRESLRKRLAWAAWCRNKQRNGDKKDDMAEAVPLQDMRKYPPGRGGEGVRNRRPGDKRNLLLANVDGEKGRAVAGRGQMALVRGPPRVITSQPGGGRGQPGVGRGPAVPRRPVNPAKVKAIQANVPKATEHKRTVEDLKGSLAQLLEDNKIKEEFQSVKLDAGLPKTVGSHPKNQKHNRFQDIVPYDHNRVQLKGRPRDYINASYINTLRVKQFIAAQGPNAEGLCDFWHMIWQEKTQHIVMLTNLVEGKQRKCHQYWPQEGKVAKYDNIMVRCTKEERSHTTTVSKLMIKKDVQNDVDIRHVWHFHFRTWPDKGVPLFPSALLNFRTKINIVLRNSRAPVVVHCSAGVGRTGTFIALDILLEDILMYKATDLHRCLTRLRRQRPSMIQNIKQYQFLYQALHEWVTVGPTDIKCSDFPRILPSLMAANGKMPPRGVTQFKEICNRNTPAAKEDPRAKIEENLKKNRGNTILPAEQYAVRLKVDDQGKSPYINAVFVDGYLCPRGYIATQAPLAETKVEFWRAVYEHACSVVVSLVPASQLKADEVYFPLNKDETLIIGRFTISCKNQRGGKDITERHLAIKPHGVEKERVIQHLCVNSPLLPKNAAAVFCILHGLSTRWQHRLPKTRTLVHCLDGAQWTGVFCASLQILNRMNWEDVFDVMDVVQNLKLVQRNFVWSQWQYNLLFQVAQLSLKWRHAPGIPQGKE